MGNINDEELSVIIQGSVDNKFCGECVKSIRNIFRKAELIISTWEGSDVSGLDYDKLVFSCDPGAVYCDEVGGVLNNVNRQLLSTQAGIAVATGKYILKTRTDIIFRDAGFLDFFGRFDGVPSPFFINRMIICNYYTRNPRILPLCFHPSDWILFGRKDDAIAYYESTPLMPTEEGNWFRSRERASPVITNYLCRFTPEQYIFLNFLRRVKAAADIDCYYDSSPTLIKETERTFAECFVVLDYQTQLNIEFAKYAPNRYRDKHTLVYHWQWRALFERYCEKHTSFRFIFYIGQAEALRALAVLRVYCVKILDFLGIKELVKRWLRNVST